MEDIYPKDFFYIQTPTSPWFSIQFRNKVTDAATNIETADIWEALSIRQNTFVKSIQIEDNGGTKKLTLVLFDQYFSYIENLVMGSLFVTRASNALYDQQGLSIQKDDLKLDFITSRNSITNLRVRIGYADTSATAYETGNTYFEAISGSGSTFEERVNTKAPTIRTPWMYFMINGVSNEITDDGLQMTITAVSLTTNALNSLKLVQEFSKIVGKPKEIITNLKAMFDSVNNIGFTIAPIGENNYDGLYSEQPVMKKEEDEIEIFLGGEPKYSKDGSLITMYKSISELFDDLCSKIPPKNIESSSDNDTMEESENFINYSWTIITDGKGKENIVFYYPNPNRGTQKYKRIYDWRETANTIVKSVNIQTATDFAIMSQKLLIKKTFTKEELNLLSISNDTGSETNIKSSLGINKLIENNEIKDKEVFNFVTDVIDIKENNNSTTNKTYTQQLKNAFLKNINRQVFKGTITLPGDSFYLFDTKLKPFEYLIKLNILRPDGNGRTVKSYLSGNYAVTSITHNVDESGYFTTLGVMRWPSKEETIPVKTAEDLVI